MNKNLLSWTVLNPTQNFQANTNASLKNLETQVGQLATTLQNKTKDVFPSDTQKNPRDCMAVQLRSGKELSNSTEKRQKRLSKKKRKKLEDRIERVVQS